MCDAMAQKSVVLYLEYIYRGKQDACDTTKRHGKHTLRNACSMKNHIHTVSTLLQVDPKTPPTHIRTHPRHVERQSQGPTLAL